MHPKMHPLWVFLKAKFKTLLLQVTPAENTSREYSCRKTSEIPTHRVQVHSELPERFSLSGGQAFRARGQLPGRRNNVIHTIVCASDPLLAYKTLLHMAEASSAWR